MLIHCVVQIWNGKYTGESEENKLNQLKENVFTKKVRRTLSAYVNPEADIENGLLSREDSNDYNNFEDDYQGLTRVDSPMLKITDVGR